MPDNIAGCAVYQWKKLKIENFFKRGMVHLRFQIELL